MYIYKISEIVAITKQVNYLNKLFLFLMIIITFGNTNLNAQIAIREDNVVEKPRFKPQRFDSLTNIVRQKRPIDYKKYIGYKLFFLPKSTNYDTKYSSDNKKRLIQFLFSKDTIEITKEGKIPFEEIMINKGILPFLGDVKKLQGSNLETYNEMLEKYKKLDKEKTCIYQPKFYYEKTDQSDGKIYGQIGTLPDSVEGKYFTILDINGRDDYRSEKVYKKLEDIDLEVAQLELKITLRNEANKDTLYWILSYFEVRGLDGKNFYNPFLLVPYFEKKRNLYLNQKIRLKDERTTYLKLQNLVDVNTGENVSIKYGEVWTCTDVSFINSKDSYYLSGFYFLKNGDKEVKLALRDDLLEDCFILETEYIKQEIEKRKNEELIKKEEQEREKVQGQAKIKFKNDCVSKWGAKMGNYIAEGKVIVGMNKEMCTAAWGNPIDINTTIVRGLTLEQWVYGWGTYLYFENGLLTGIQN